MDLVEGLTMSNGKCANFVVINRLSKYAHFIPHPYSYIAIGVARFFFFITFSSCHGIPKSILCDQDLAFTSVLERVVLLK